MAAIDISNLNADQRLELIGELWDSLSLVPDDVRLTDTQREELDLRLAKLEHDQAQGALLGSPVGEVLNRVRLRRWKSRI